MQLDPSAREAIHAQRNAAQAVEIARMKQLEEIAAIVRTEVMDILAQGSEQDKSVILARVPFICQDIKEIKGSLSEMNEKLSSYPLVKSIVFGAVSFILVAFLSGVAALVFINHAS